ncbi:sensor histidine kinase [Bacillus sp. B-jedd]|uniref:sensor histidine kinase n=1 Tax=Bacillus sp. B-jedd TaxID=1476857 RepID=UPI0005155529|nr:HAMP domain-containing sensor histidine kinase [Bacillus sp. B-jedd]CEG27085.1 two-component sensor histidine kinase [Bacillus sp. B-jedd]
MRSHKFKNTLIFKLLIAIAVSFLVSMAVLVSFSWLIILFFNIHYVSELSIVTYNIIELTLFSFSFLVTFYLMIRKKLLYLKMITDSVNDIAAGKLGLTIELAGKDELSQLAQNINGMSKELANKFDYERQLEMAKNELITNVSHDLRSPLTSIIGYLDLLRKGNYSDQKQLNDYLDTSYLKSKRLESLINELFEYTRLSSPDVKLDYSEVGMTGLLEQLIGEYIPIFEREKLTIVKALPNEEIHIAMDVEKMVRVYENLFMNAIKYSLKPSDIHISLDRLDSLVILKISNQVENPPLEDLNKLFERFFVGDKARKNNQGTGLGLAISKRIVELHGGTIQGEYKEGWLTFMVEHQLNSCLRDFTRLS